MSRKKSGYLEAARTQRVNHPLSVFAVLRLHRDFQNSVADIQIDVRSVMVNDHDVRALGGNDATGHFELPRPILHEDAELGHAPGAKQTLLKAHTRQKADQLLAETREKCRQMEQETLQRCRDLVEQIRRQVDRPAPSGGDEPVPEEAAP